MVNWNLAVSESLPLLAEGKQTATQSAGTADRVSASRWDAGANRPSRQARLVEGIVTRRKWDRIAS